MEEPRAANSCIRIIARQFGWHRRQARPVAAAHQLGVTERVKADDGAALALGTGNVRDTAYVKLQRFGLDDYFPVGGFGGDHEMRADLVRHALDEARAHYGYDFDPADTWVIGDTAADVHAAQATGCRVMAVMTGPHREAELAAADLIVHDLGATRERLEQLVT